MLDDHYIEEWDSYPEFIEGFKLQRTCCACPEQYDVTLDGKQTAYMRLRHGRFTVTVPDVGGELVYKEYPLGDGIFDTDERDGCLTRAIQSVKRHLERKEEEEEYAKRMDSE